MSHDVHKVRAFEHPGEGRRRAKATPKGRQVDPTAAKNSEKNKDANITKYIKK